MGGGRVAWGHLNPRCRQTLAETLMQWKQGYETPRKPLPSFCYTDRPNG